MAKEWTDEEVQKEIADAVAIVREDRFEKFVRGNMNQPPTNDSNKNPPNSGGTNPDPNAGNKKRKSLWWGEVDE